MLQKRRPLTQFCLFVPPLTATICSSFIAFRTVSWKGKRNSIWSPISVHERHSKITHMSPNLRILYPLISCARNNSEKMEFRLQQRLFSMFNEIRRQLDSLTIHSSSFSNLVWISLARSPSGSLRSSLVVPSSFNKWTKPSEMSNVLMHKNKNKCCSSSAKAQINTLYQTWCATHKQFHPKTVRNNQSGVHFWYF